MLSFLGWLIGSPRLSGFGLSHHPDWPLSAIANAVLAIALLAIMQGHERVSRWLICVPVSISGVVLVEYMFGTSPVFDALLFGDEVRAISLPMPGRPGLLPTFSILLVSLLAIVLSRRERWADHVILAVMAITIGFGAMSVAALVLDVRLIDEGVRLTGSLPASIAPVAMAIGASIWRISVSRSGAPMTNYAEWRRARVALPVILVLPAIVLPIEAWLSQAGIVSHLAGDVAGSLFNFLLIVLLLIWAVARIADENDALRESERRVALATEAHGVGIFDWDTRTNALTWMPGAETRLGLSPGTIRSFDDWLAIVPDEDVQSVVATVQDTAAQRLDKYCFRYRVRQPDGTLRIIEGSARAFYDDAGRMVRSLGVNMDVTEREARAAALQASEEQLRLILATVPDAVVIIDDHGVIRSFSSAAERMFGYDAQAVVNANVSMLMPDMMAAAHDGYLERYRATGQRHIIGSVRVLTARRADGTEFPIELNVGEAQIGTERLFTGFIRDISQRMAAQEHLEAVRNEYVRSARLSGMGEIGAGLAHELNQPLAATANFLGVAEIVLADMPGGERAAEQVALANAQIQRAGEIIRRLRNFIAKGEVDMRSEPLGQIVQDAAALGLIGNLQYKIDLVVRLDPDASTVVVDRIQIQQVLVNLLRNAAEAVRNCPPDRRVIEIVARAIDDAMTEISVIDSGPGVAEDVIGQIYTPFLSTKGADGLGIGLSICRRIVEGHGGTISASNRPGGGARVTFTVKRSREEQATGKLGYGGAGD